MPKISLFESDLPQKLEMDDHQWSAFQIYLDEVWRNRFQFADLPDDHLSGAQAFFHLAPHQIQARHYVGYLRYEDLTLRVFPKFFKNLPDQAPGYYYLHLLYYLSYCQRLRFPFLSSEAEAFSSDHFPDLWIFLFVAFTEQLLSEQAFRRYEEKEEASPFVKGRLATKAYLQRSLGTGQWHQLYVQHQPWAYDNLLNQVIKYVCRQLLLRTGHEGIRDKLQHILFILRQVTDCTSSYADCQRITLSSRQAAWQQVLDTCRLFLLNEQINADTGNYLSFSFLLPMPYIYEDFIFGFIQTHFPHWQAEQQSADFLARTKVDGRAVFQIKNDIYLPQQKIILDTKYKMRDYPFTDEKTGVDQGDMYQMLSYGIARQCNHIVLLYPAYAGEENSNDRQSEFIIEGGLLGDNVLQVKAVDIDIALPPGAFDRARLDQKITEQLTMIIEQ